MNQAEDKVETAHELQKGLEKHTVGHRRRIRQDIISSKRLPLSYLKDVDVQLRNQIMDSLSGPIPDPLPPLSTTTISYYRRAGKPRFKAGYADDSHCVYQSLCMLALLDEDKFFDYHEVVSTFEDCLHEYLNSRYRQIAEMAVLAAGNKCLGSEADIITMCQLNESNIWVLINHVLEQKIGFEVVLPGLLSCKVECFRCISDLLRDSPGKCQIVLEEVLKSKDECIVKSIVEGIISNERDICCSSLSILASLFCSNNEKKLSQLARYWEIVKFLETRLVGKDEQIKSYACWLLSNIPAGSCDRSTLILSEQSLIQHTFEMVVRESTNIQEQLLYFFLNLIEEGASEVVKNFLMKTNFIESVLERCLEVDKKEVQLLAVKLLVLILDKEDNWSGAYFRNRIARLTPRINSLSYSIGTKEPAFDLFERHFQHDG